MASRSVRSRVELPPFQALLDAHGRDVHRFLMRDVGPVDADDCYQETWLAALRAYPRLRDADEPARLAADDRPPQGDRLRPGSQPAAVPVADVPELADGIRLARR